ncbi:hypothetical protein [Dictyobacter halimunensis]
MPGSLDLRMWEQEVKEAQVHGNVVLSNGGRLVSLHIEVSVAPAS